GIHRANLHQILWQKAEQLGVPIYLNNAIQNFTHQRDAVVVQHQQASDCFDALIVANGTRSQLRQQLPIPQISRQYSWGAYWAVLDKDDWPFPTILMQRYRGAHVMLGVLPTGLNPLTKKPCYSLFWSLPRAEFGLYQAQGMIGLIERIRPIWPEVADWLADAPDTPIAIAEYADVRMSIWHHQNVVVIGDAAHAMSPQLGQGANIALIDATVLAQCLQNQENIADALKSYSKKRAKHIAYYQTTSRIMTPLYQSHYPLGWMRDLGTMIGRQIPSVYRQYLLTLAGAKQGNWDFRASIDDLMI
ncbi:MAG: FAD-dependent monooxygenase, partial [Undibacterium sp.]|nr:FAD-dependent monooxygenase [Undibacterium sp.]